jgi:hypothetical protein
VSEPLNASFRFGCTGRCLLFGVFLPTVFPLPLPVFFIFAADLFFTTFFFFVTFFFFFETFFLRRIGALLAGWGDIIDCSGVTDSRVTLRLSLYTNFGGIPSLIASTPFGACVIIVA